MMEKRLRFKIHYELTSGEEDYVMMAGETIEEIRQKWDIFKKDRGLEVTNEWSEQL
jgi:hypothetical protein